MRFFPVYSCCAIGMRLIISYYNNTYFFVLEFISKCAFILRYMELIHKRISFQPGIRSSLPCSVHFYMGLYKPLLHKFKLTCIPLHHIMYVCIDNRKHTYLNVIFCVTIQQEFSTRFYLLLIVPVIIEI